MTKSPTRAKAPRAFDVEGGRCKGDLEEVSSSDSGELCQGSSEIKGKSGPEPGGLGQHPKFTSYGICFAVTKVGKRTSTFQEHAKKKIENVKSSRRKDDRNPEGGTGAQ